MQSVMLARWHPTLSVAASTSKLQEKNKCLIILQYLFTSILDLFLRRSSFPESILEFTRHGLHVSHAAGTGRSAALCFETPIVLSHFAIWVTTTGTALFLNVIGSLATPTARRV